MERLHWTIMGDHIGDFPGAPGKKGCPGCKEHDNLSGCRPPWQDRGSRSKWEARRDRLKIDKLWAKLGLVKP